MNSHIIAKETNNQAVFKSQMIFSAFAARCNRLNCQAEFSLKVHLGIAPK
jgi:hypothetical protein